LVVHGPLNLILMVNFWRDIRRDGNGEEVWPKRVKYRATHPIYAGESYRICMEKEDRGGGTEMKIVDEYGNIGMVGRIERF
jgi:hydroxyacyl-ACP dehydratase HTD2-like protein with hotdog domain